MRWSISALAMVLATAVVLPARAADKPAGDASRVEQAVARGVSFLLTKQDDDGAIGRQERRNRSNENVMSALSVMALAAVGHQPVDETPEGRALRKALDFILGEDQQDDTGYFGKADGSRMYGHGITTLMLAEMMGMGVDSRQDALIRQRCQKAIDLIVRSQKVRKREPRFYGGWRYTPDANDADLSVTVWQVMALRAAKNAGLTVPKETIDAAVGYLKRSYESNRDQNGRILNLRSGFGYEPGNGPTYSTASAGLLALQVCGEYDAPELRGCADWLSEQKVDHDQRWFFYGTYYYSQGMYQRGGEHAQKARRIVEDALLGMQKPDGSWRGQGQEGESSVYSTSLAILSLSVRHHFMPIYQR